MNYLKSLLFFSMIFLLISSCTKNGANNNVPSVSSAGIPIKDIWIGNGHSYTDVYTYDNNLRLIASVQYSVDSAPLSYDTTYISYTYLGNNSWPSSSTTISISPLPHGKTSRDTSTDYYLCDAQGQLIDDSLIGKSVGTLYYTNNYYSYPNGSVVSTYYNSVSPTSGSGSVQSDSTIYSSQNILRQTNKFYYINNGKIVGSVDSNSYSYTYSSNLNPFANFKAFAIGNEVSGRSKTYPSTLAFVDYEDVTFNYSATYTYSLDSKGRVIKIVENANPRSYQFSGTYSIFYQ